MRSWTMGLLALNLLEALPVYAQDHATLYIGESTTYRGFFCRHEMTASVVLALIVRNGESSPLIIPEGCDDQTAQIIPKEKLAGATEPDHGTIWHIVRVRLVEHDKTFFIVTGMNISNGLEL